MELIFVIDRGNLAKLEKVVSNLGDDYNVALKNETSFDANINYSDRFLKIDANISYSGRFLNIVEDTFTDNEYGPGEYFFVLAHREFNSPVFFSASGDMEIMRMVSRELNKNEINHLVDIDV